jgi:hypothetical protein
MPVSNGTIRVLDEPGKSANKIPNSNNQHPEKIEASNPKRPIVLPVW